MYILAEAKLETVILYYLRILVLVASNFGLAWLIVYLSKSKCPKLLSERNRLICVIIGTGLLLLAGIGKLGWSIQSYDDKTTAEKLNDWIFWIVSYAGTLLIFIKLNYGLVQKTSGGGIKDDGRGVSKKVLTTKTVLTALSIVTLIVCVYFGVSRNYQPMWATFLAFGILLFFAHIESLAEFTINMSGFTAKTRKLFEEAQSTVKELKSLAKIMASTTLGLVKRTGRWGGYSYDEKEEIKESTLNVLHEIGIPEEEIEEVVKKSKWHEFVEFDFALAILGGSKAWPPDLPQNLQEEWSKSRRKFGFNNIAKPADLTKILDKYGLLSDEAKELITDYEYYIKHRKQRRPEVWAKREKWSHLRRNNNQQ